MATFILWVILAIISFPLAIAVLILYPFIWLILLPFRLVGFAVGTVFDILKAIILFPFKVFH
ncbi:MAG: hypothetical protein HYS24_06965 [Ignavibacteriales bacterium]|nr:hypothetical protein [Ignavibacteriales bacterium]MBK7978766.1 hypothetical protein [Ignavibacteriota bacterium]